LERYAGLSGLAAGMLVLLAVLKLRTDTRESRLFWYAVLALVAAKIGLELRTGAPLLIRGPSDLTSVPLSHLGGVIAGSLAGWLTGRRT
jgi:membrane associated rhomboid family serine protease